MWGSNKKEASSVPEVRDYGSIKKSNPNISTKIHSFTFKIAKPIKQLTLEASKGTKMKTVGKICTHHEEYLSLLPQSSLGKRVGFRKNSLGKRVNFHKNSLEKRA